MLECEREGEGWGEMEELDKFQYLVVMISANGEGGAP